MQPNQVESRVRSKKSVRAGKRRELIKDPEAQKWSSYIDFYWLFVLNFVAMSIIREGFHRRFEGNQPIFAGRQIELMNLVLLDGLLKSQEIAMKMEISEDKIQTLVGDICNRAEERGERNSLKGAVVVAVSEGLVDISSLPDRLLWELSETMGKLWSLQIKGLTKEEIGRELKIKEKTVRIYNQFLIKSFGVKNIYQVIAIGAKLAKDRPQDV